MLTPVAARIARYTSTSKAALNIRLDCVLGSMDRQMQAQMAMTSPNRKTNKRKFVIIIIFYLFYHAMSSQNSLIYMASFVLLGLQTWGGRPMFGLQLVHFMPGPGIGKLIGWSLPPSGTKRMGSLNQLGLCMSAVAGVPGTLK